MKITERAYKKLLECPFVPPELGGIIGGHGDLIDHVMFDTPPSDSNQTNYSPNTELLNRCIEDWRSQGIQWFGLFHTHAAQWTTLSSADLEYINTIVNSVLEDGESLLFPLVFPHEGIQWYLATKSNAGVRISEEIIIIQKET